MSRVMDANSAVFCIDDWFRGLFMVGQIDLDISENCVVKKKIEQRLRAAFKAMRFIDSSHIPKKLYRFAVISKHHHAPLKENTYRVVHPGGLFPFQSWTDDWEIAEEFASSIGISNFSANTFEDHPGETCIISVSNFDNKQVLFSHECLKNLVEVHNELCEELEVLDSLNIEFWLTQREYVFEAGKRIRVKIEQIIDMRYII